MSKVNQYLAESKKHCKYLKKSVAFSSFFLHARASLFGTNTILEVRNKAVLHHYRTSCVKQCYSICACILYKCTVLCTTLKNSIIYVHSIAHIYNIHAYPSPPLSPTPLYPQPINPHPRKKVIIMFSNLIDLIC